VFNQAAVESLLATVRQGAEELASLFKVDISTPIAVDRVLGEAEDLRVQREMLQYGLSPGSPLQWWNQSPAGNVSRQGPSIGDETSGEGPAAHAAATVAGGIVSPPIFRQQLRLALAAADLRDGCVGVMICEVTRQSTESGGNQKAANLLLPNRISEEIGNEGLVTMSGPGRAMLFIPRADHIIIARLAHTISRHLTQALHSSCAPADGESTLKDNSTAPQPAAEIHFNIGAAAFDRASRAVITDEQKLISLAEQALNCAIAAGRGAVRIFNPSQSDERAA
jgi:hypothetical protein